MSGRVACVVLLLSAAASASVLRVEVIERSDVLDGKSIGAAGPYERIIARVRFEIDPKLPANRIISDIDFDPRNDKGLVEFSSDLYVLKPLDPARGNGTVLFEVSNRGAKGMLNTFNYAASARDPQSELEFGDGFLLERGFTLAWLGWQFDVPKDPSLMRLYAPVARDGDRAVTGPIRAEFVPDRRVLSFSLADRTMIAYPVANPDDPSLQLMVRTRNDGPRRAIPRARWRFAREEKGKPVADLTSVFMSSGFEPGRIYELVYTAKDPVLVGLGPAAVRDFISFLKYGAPGSAVTLLGDQPRFIKRALGFGTSQSGRFLRTFLYCGFNRDERSRKVFDGIWAHVAGGGRGSFNHRFAQPSRDGHPFMNFFYPTDIFPFTDLEQTDPETGVTGGILAEALKTGVAPKIFYTNSSYEYYGRAASLIHTDVDGKADAALAKDTRVYLFAGTKHGPGSWPPARDGKQHLDNPIDFRPLMRALLAAMEGWLARSVEPPPSQYPRIADGKLVALAAVNFPKIRGVAFPRRIHKGWRVDYGPEFRSRGIVSIEPPIIGKPFAMLLPQVDADGNETAGIRLPEVEVPLATYTGWNHRHPKLGAPDELFSMAGSFLPFPATEAERARRRDPRPSIEARYKSREEYVARCEKAARELMRQGYLLERDIPRLLGHARELWDALARAAGTH